MSVSMLACTTRESEERFTPPRMPTRQCSEQRWRRDSCCPIVFAPFLFVFSQQISSTRRKFHLRNKYRASSRCFTPHQRKMKAVGLAMTFIGNSAISSSDQDVKSSHVTSVLDTREAYSSHGGSRSTTSNPSVPNSFS